MRKRTIRRMDALKYILYVNKNKFNTLDFLRKETNKILTSRDTMGNLELAHVITILIRRGQPITRKDKIILGRHNSIYMLKK